MRALRFILFMFFFTQIGSFTLKAQFTHADSVYLANICKEGMYISYWNHPGNWYHHKEVTSLQNFYDQIDSSYVFHNDEFADCYRKISTSDILERDTLINARIDTFEKTFNTNLFGHKNPFVKLQFNLNNKTAYSYALLDSTSAPVYNTDNAFVIISGTGTNQLKTIVDGTGYHDMNCNMRNLLNPYGDTYIMSMPNEDHRAIYFNRKKIASLPNYQVPYLFTYLNADNKSLGLNRLIETVAFIKYLKTKYKKVFVLGLSTGGKVALWASLLSEPDASIIASGYSVLVDNDYNAQLINSMSYGNYLLVYDKDSTRSRLSQLHTQFLFTQAQNDGALTQLDIDSSITKNFFSSLNNASYYYNFYNHSFPPCPVSDSFLQRCFLKPKVFLTTDTNLCNADSVVMNLSFLGSPPFNFQLYKDSTFISNHISNTNQMSISIFNEGNYLIKNIVDNGSYIGYTSDTFKYVKDIQPNALLTQKEFVCDSSKTKILFDFTGQGPYTVFYTKNNLADSMTFYNTHDSALFADGNYQFISLKGYKQCGSMMQTNMVLNNPAVSFQVSNVSYNCGSNKNEVMLTTTGMLPLQIYFYDSLIQTMRNVVLNNYSHTLFLDSGAYTFVNIVDSNHCSKSIDSSIALNSQAVSFNHGNLSYNCGETFAIMPIQLQGKSNWNILMEHNGVQQVLTKTSKSDTLHIPYDQSKILKVTDGNNCVYTVVDSIVQNNYKKLTVNVFTEQFDCINKNVPIQLLTQGNYPMQLMGYRNNQVFSENIVSPTTNMIVDLGPFTIDSIIDRTQCVITDLYESAYTNDTFLVEGIEIDKLILKTTNTSFNKYYWFLNDQLIKETSDPFIPIEKNGIYEVGVFNNNQCFLKTQKIRVNLGKMTIYPNPFTTEINILVSLDPNEKINYYLTDMTGNKMGHGLLHDGLNQLSMPEMNRGIYLLNFETNMKNIQYPSQKVFKN